MENAIYLQTFAALCFVIGMILLLGWAGRKFGLAGLEKPPKDADTRRLALIESMRLDPSRRLVLIRRDNTAHLLLIGGTRDIVVESGIDPESALLQQPENNNTGEA